MKTYRISELGRHFGLSRTTLLYYDQIGLLRPDGRSDTGYRLYSQADFERLERVCLFREAGLSLEEIACLLDEPAPDDSILSRRLKAIGEEISALRAQQKLIAGMLKTVSGKQAPTGLDAGLWLSLQKACGLDEDSLKRWHAEFERHSPEAHQAFLLGLGLNEKEAIQVRMLTRNVEKNTMSMKYFYELFEELPRQGPGCQEATLRALDLVKDLPAKPAVLDIGCGCGMQTRLLAKTLNTRILAIDNHRPVLERLSQAAKQEGLDIETREMSMLDMPFEPEHFDLIWAEGSIFIIGLEHGLVDFRRYLKPGGYMAFTEMCWFGEARPTEPQAWFDKVYPDIRSISEILELAAECGYTVIEHFKLPDSAWWDDYYTPMLARIAELKPRNAGVSEAEAVYGACEEEVEMFRKYSRYYGYAFFVLRRA